MSVIRDFLQVAVLTTVVATTAQAETQPITGFIIYDDSKTKNTVPLNPSINTPDFRNMAFSQEFNNGFQSMSQCLSFFSKKYSERKAKVGDGSARGFCQSGDTSQRFLCPSNGQKCTFE